MNPTVAGSPLQWGAFFALIVGMLACSYTVILAAAMRCLPAIRGETMPRVAVVR